MDLKLPLDNNGRAAGIVLNDLKAAYNYNAQGQLDRIDLPGGQSIQIARDAASRPTSFVFGKAATLTVAYDKADRVTSLDAKKTADAKSIFAESYSYDGAGNVAEVRSGKLARKFEYDKENRLTKVLGPKPQSYEYDGDGNLRTHGDQKSRWTLDKLGRPLELKGTRYSYDGNGNLTKTTSAAEKIENQFDAADRLVRRIDGKKTWSYGYLANGDRLWLQSAEGKSWWAYLPDGLVGIKDAGGIVWLIVYLPGTDWPLALCGSNGKTFFTIADHLHSSRRYFDTSGAVIAGADFGPFGEPEAGGGNKPRGLFAGMVRDESGLYYARQRYYGPRIGRFLSIDPELGSAEVPATHNLYAYAGNNPLRNRDPLGTDFASEVAADGNNLYHVLSDAQQAALKEAWDGAERARRVLSGGMKSAASETAAAAQHLKECEAAMAKIHEIAKATYKYSLLKNGPTAELSEVGKQNLAKNLAKAKSELEALGEAPRIGRLALGENASKLGSTLQNTESVSRLQAEAAERAAEKKAAEEAASKATTETAKKAGEEIAETVGSKLWRAVKGLGPFLQILGAVADIHTIAETDYYATKMYGAESDELKSRKLAKEIRDKLDEEIRRIAKDEPGRLGPMNDGRMPDPNNPDDIDQLIIDMHINLNKKRPPFEGVIKPREEKPEDKTASKKAEDDAAAKNLAEALETARKLIARGHEMEDSVRNAQAKAAKAEVEAKDAVQKATTVATIQGALDFDVAAVPVTANTVKTQTAAVKAQKEKLQTAYDEMVAAGAVCDAASATVCGLAGQAEGATAEQIKAWQAEAVKTLQTASDKLNAAQAKIDSTEIGIDELRMSTNFLQGFSFKLAAIKAAAKAAEITDNTSEGALAMAKAANAQAEAARAEIPGLLSKIKGLAGQATGILQPFASDPSTAALIAEANALGTGLDDNTSIFDINSLVSGAAPIVNPLVSLVKSATDALGAIDIDSILSDAQSTLNDAEILRTSARALAKGPERYQSLQTASQCYAKLKASEKNIAQASPTPTPTELAAASPTPTAPAEMPSASPQPSTRIAEASPTASSSPGSTTTTAAGTMPNLIGLTLDQAVTRLTGKMRIGSDEAGDKPPKPEKAYTIFSQTPAPGTKLDPNKETVVSVKRYGSAKSVVEQPPEETPPAVTGTNNPNDFVGEWERGGKEGGSIVIT
ncbi:MAG TPA: RHS repeat-associated core domain-containing protein, partial [Chthoniobacterales bacterium]|nr:RHS repeat-associated core domain-containing protein [Chthoniobacterales bacterium]